jgi:hypothetical protein
VADAGIGKPRWHFASGGAARDLREPFVRVPISDERHRSDFTGAVAGLATILEDRQNVFVERGRRVKRAGDREAKE